MTNNSISPNLAASKNAVYLFSATIALTSLFLFFSFDALTNKDKQLIATNLMFGRGVVICLCCMPIIGFITYALQRNIEKNRDSIKLKYLRLLCLFICFINIIGIHLILTPIELSWYGVNISVSIFSGIALTIAGLLYICLNRYLKLK